MFLSHEYFAAAVLDLSICRLLTLLKREWLPNVLVEPFITGLLSSSRCVHSVLTPLQLAVIRREMSNQTDLLDEELRTSLCEVYDLSHDYPWDLPGSSMCPHDYVAVFYFQLINHY